MAIKGKYMALVNRCMEVLVKDETGVTWERLMERIEILRNTTNRERALVYKHLLDKSTLWNNGAQDMGATLFIHRHFKPVETDDVNVPLNIPKKPANKMVEKMKAVTHTSKGIKPVEVKEPTPAPKPVAVGTMAEEITTFVDQEYADNPPPVSPEEDALYYMYPDIMLEMAWHVQRTEDRGMTISRLRNSVDEYSDSSDEVRAWLLNTMRQRYNVGYYKKVLGDGKEIKVLRFNDREAETLVRPQRFADLAKLYGSRAPRQYVNGQTTDRLSYGVVKGNAMADAFAGLNAAALFAEKAGSEEDEYDEQYDNEAGEVIEDVPPLVTILREATAKPAELKLVVAEPTPAPEPVAPIVKAEPVFTPVTTTPAPTVSHRKEVHDTADLLRLMADQLEEQADQSEKLTLAKNKFDILMSRSRESTKAIGIALAAHNNLLNELQEAADELSSL